MIQIIYRFYTSIDFLKNILAFLQKWYANILYCGLYFLLVHAITTINVSALEPTNNIITNNTTDIVVWQNEPIYQGWLRKETEYFTYIFERKDIKVIQDLETLIKKYSAPLQDIFEHHIKRPEKVHIIIDGRSGYSNGSFRTIPPELRLHTHPSGKSGKDTNWIQYLFLHEFAHYLHTYYPSGLGQFLSYIFGPVAKSSSVFLTPLWLVEGLAVYIESAYSNIGRLHNPFFTLPMRADILLDTILPYSISQLNTSFEFQYGRRYLYGSFLFRYIQKQYGFDTFIELWREYLQFPINFESFVKKKLKKSLENIHDEMKDSLYTQYFSESGNFPRGKMLRTSILPSDKLSLVASTDKGSIYYKQGNDTPSGFVLLSQNTMQEKNLLNISANTTSFGTGSADATKDGNMLVFVARTYNTKAHTTLSNATYNGYTSFFNDIYTYSTVSNTLTQISQQQQLSMPSISNDASFIVATKIDSTNNSLIKIDMSNYTQGYEVLYPSTSSEILDKDISPNNSYVTFIEKSVDEGSSIVVLDIATKQRTYVLQSNSVLFYDLRFIDNTTVQFSSDMELPGAVLQLYRFNIENTQLIRIARDSVGIVSAISTINDDIIYQSNSGNGFNLYYYTKKNIEAMSDPINIATLENINMPYNIASFKKITSAPIQTSLSKDIYSVWSFFPNRLAYFLPTLLLQYKNTTTSFNPGITVQFFSPNSLSNLYIQFLQYLDTKQTSIHFQPVYNIIYGYSLRPIGDILISSSRSINYLSSSHSYAINYSNTFSYGKFLWNDVHNNTIRLIASSSIYSTVLTPSSLKLMQSYNIRNFLSLQRFGLLLRYSGRSASSSRYNPLSWSNELGTYYHPPYWVSDYHQYLYVLKSTVRIPLAKNFAIKISNKNTLSDGTNFTSLQQLHRLNQIPNITLLNSSKKLLLAYDTAFNNSPFKSIWSLDFIIPLGYNDTYGNANIQPYAFYLNIYTDHSFAIDNNGAFIQSSYYDIGAENKTMLTILGFNTLISIGSLFRISYDTRQFDYRLYILFGN